jgi:hypothetical protein
MGGQVGERERVKMKAIRLLVVFALCCAGLWAQATSQIQGTVQDASGAAVPGAEVKATQTDTSTVRTTTSGADGTYVLPNLPIGPYRLEVSKQGFTTYVQTGIVLQVNSNPTINMALNVGAVSEQVQVEANATLVETQPTGLGQVIDNRRILELPLNGRNPVELIQLAGAAVPGGKNGTAGFPGGLNISVAGGLLSGVSYFLDGTLYNNPFDAVNLPFPFPDALQEFKVETNSLTAQNGMHSAAAVSAVVKSGTNSYHGDLFEFFRNGDLNARNFFASRRDTLKRNQYGGTIGGPIKKDKLFFFAGYQGTKTRSDPADQTATVPTAAMLAGDFSQCPGITVINPATGLPFPGNQITTPLSPQALAIAAKLPKTTDPCGSVKWGPVTKINEYQVLGRGDYQINDKQTFFARYMASAYLQPAAYSLSGNVLDTRQGALDNLAQTWAIGHTYVISPTTVNQLRVSANRTAVHRVNDDYFSGCDIGAQMYCFVPHQTNVVVSGAFNVGIATAIQASFIPSYYTLSDDLNIVKGSHQFAFGFSGFKYQHSQKANIAASANFTFGGLPKSSPTSLNQGTGVPLADFLLGRMNSFQQGSPNTVFTTKWYFGLYAQDSWKASRRLTINYGVRWEPFLPQRLNNGAVYTFSWDRFLAGQRSTAFTNAPLGLYYPGDPGFPDLTGVPNRYNQFAPRLGLAFDPTGDGKTSIRASFGMSYDFPNTQIMSNPASAPPYGNSVNRQGVLNPADPWAGYPGGNPFPGSFGPNVPFIFNGQYLAQDPNAKATTVYTWNFGIQRQLTGNWLVSATYLGTQSIHLWTQFQQNPAVIVACPGGAVFTTCNSASNTNARRLANQLNPTEGRYFQQVDQFESGATSNYNGLILTAEKRLSRGISFNANYTWSHCIGDITQGSTVGGFGVGLQDPNNRRLDRGNCQTPTLDGTQSLDRHHIANFTAVLEAPRFQGRALRLLASDWKLSSSYRVLSGAYQTLSTGVDYALNGSSTAVQRPNQVLADPLVANTLSSCPGVQVSCRSWINPAAFAQPALGTFGNSGRSSVPGPGFFSLDMALSRIFRVHEGQTLEVRGEAFNLTNGFRAGGSPVGGASLAAVVTARNSTQFGQIRNAFDPRIMQLAMKFVF